MTDEREATPPPPAEVIPIGRLKGPFVANLGMAMFLFSWALSFVGIGVAYLIIWGRTSVWPPEGTPTRPWSFPLLNTLLAVGSSITFHLAVRSAENSRAQAVRRWMVVTATLAGLFMLLQTIMWTQLRGAGFTLGKNVYIGMFYALTGFHALHVVAGIGTLAAMTPRAMRGGFNARDYTTLRLAGWFWHFVTIAWIGVFVLLWLI